MVSPPPMDWIVGHGLEVETGPASDLGEPLVTWCSIYDLTCAW